MKGFRHHIQTKRIMENLRYSQARTIHSDTISKLCIFKDFPRLNIQNERLSMECYPLNGAHLFNYSGKHLSPSNPLICFSVIFISVPTCLTSLAIQVLSWFCCYVYIGT